MITPEPSGVLRRSVLPILITILLGSLLGGIITFLLPPVFAAEAVLLVPEDSPQLSAMILPNSGGSKLDFIDGIFGSDRFGDLLLERTQASEDDRDWKKWFYVSVDTRRSQLSIRALGASREEAKKRAAEALAILKQLLKTPEASVYSQRLVTLTNEQNVVEGRIALINRRLTDLRTKNQAIIGAEDGRSSEIVVRIALNSAESKRLEEQINARQQGLSAAEKADVNVLASAVQSSPVIADVLKARRDYELRLLVAGPDDPDLRRLEKEVRRLEQLLKQDAASRAKAAGLGFEEGMSELIVQKAGLDASVAFLQQVAEKLPRDIESLQNLLFTREVERVNLKATFEALNMEKLSQLKHESSYSIFQQPRLERKPVNKTYSLAIALGAFVGFCIHLLRVVIWPRLLEMDRAKTTGSPA